MEYILLQMATLESAERLLEDLRVASYEGGKKELAEVVEYAHAHGHEGDVMHWDNTFWSERMKEEKYSINDELLRPYFALPTVLDGLFKVRPVAYTNLSR